MSAAAADLYRTLGVLRSADAAAVKAAYRKLAKRAHPDSGGTPEAFDRLRKAALVLGDPDARAHYDKTGEAKEPRISDADGPALGFIAGMLMGLVHGENDPFTTDLIACMREHIGKELAELAQHEAKARASLARARKMDKRFTRRRRKATEGQPDFMASIVRSNIAQIERTLEKQAGERRLRNRADEILADYEFRKDDPAPQWVTVTMMGGSTSTTSGVRFR